MMMGSEERAVARCRDGQLRAKKVRRDGWTAARVTAFMETLAMTSNVSAAARAAGIAKINCYRKRMRDPGFRLAWMQALAEGYEHLEMEMLERARFGTKKIVVQGGREVGNREYSDANGFRLIQAHRATVEAWRLAEAEGRAPEEVLAEVRRRIEEAEAIGAGMLIEGVAGE